MGKFHCSNFEGTKTKVYNNKGGTEQFLNLCNLWDVVEEVLNGKVITTKW